jgi:cytochrome c oxidase subunit I
MPADYGSSPVDSYLSDSKGWLATSDHKRIGVLYLASVGVTLLLGTILAFVGRAQASMSGLHASVMAFLFLIPAIFGGIGNIVLPMQVGAKGVAYPRLNLVGLYLFWIGACVTLVTTATGGGWVASAPVVASQALPSFVGALVMALSSALTGINFIGTVNGMRAPGLGWGRLSLFSWSIYAASVVQILVAPVLVIAVVLLATRPEMFDSRAAGGSGILLEQLFWRYAHPAIYAMIVPSMGIVSEIVATFARRRIVGYWSLAFSGVAIAALGLFAWGQHLFVSGISDVSAAQFSAMALLVTVPAGLAIANWLATLSGGSISLESPMLWALAFIVQFTIGMASGLFVGALATGVALHGTYFSLAQFHYLVVGGAATAFLGGLHYWWPKVTGKRYSESLARIGFALVCGGTNIAFLPQFAAGAQGAALGQPNASADALQMVSMVGALLLLVGLLVLAFMFVSSLRGGQKASRNPWGSVALEWQSPSPAPVANFVGAPRLEIAPYEYHLATAQDLE